MKNNPLVSVIIIFFNGEKFFEEAIESVINQTYEDWELLLVDDGSTDNSTAIAQTYVEKYPEKIRYLEHPNHTNKGMSTTRNLGMRNSCGKYIALLDCDDVWLPQKLQQQVEIMNLHPQIGMVYGPSLRWHSWDIGVDNVSKDNLYPIGVEPNTLLKPPELLILYLEDIAVPPCPSNLLFTRELFERVGGFEESWQGLFEDQVFLTKVFLKETVFVAGECWLKYRKHPDSCVSVVQKAGLSEEVEKAFRYWQEKYFLEQGVSDPQIWKTLKQYIFPYRYPWLYFVQQQTLTLLSKGRNFYYRAKTRIKSLIKY